MAVEWSTIAVAVVLVVAAIIFAHEVGGGSGAGECGGPVLLRRQMVDDDDDGKKRARLALTPSSLSGGGEQHSHSDDDSSSSQQNVIVPAGGRHAVRKRITIHGNVNEVHLKDIRLVNVVAVELVRANFPRGQYTIDRHNNRLDIVVSNVTYAASLPVGNAYTVQSIADALTEITPLTFTFECSTSRYRVSSPDGAAFSLLFGTGKNRDRSMCRELGFEYGKDYNASLLGNNNDILSVAQLVSPLRADLSGARFLSIHTDELDGLHQRGMLAQIPVVPPTALVTYNPGAVDRRRFENPITLNHLTFHLCDYDMMKDKLRPYEFHGLYWSMTLEITTMDVSLPMELLSSAENDWHQIERVYRAPGRIAEAADHFLSSSDPSS